MSLWCVSFQIPVVLWGFTCFDDIFNIFVWNPPFTVQFLIVLKFFCCLLCLDFIANRAEEFSIRILYRMSPVVSSKTHQHHCPPPSPKPCSPGSFPQMCPSVQIGLQIFPWGRVHIANKLPHSCSHKYWVSYTSFSCEFKHAPVRCNPSWYIEEVHGKSETQNSSQL